MESFIVSTTSVWKRRRESSPYIGDRIILCRGASPAVNSNYFVIKKNRFPARPSIADEEGRSVSSSRESPGRDGKGMKHIGDFSSTFR